MQWLCIGSDGNDGDIPLMKVMVNWRTHDHHKPHPETTLSRMKKNKNNFIHSCRTAPFVFFYEWKRLHYPKISGPTCRMNVMLIISEVFVFFSPQDWIYSIISSILFEPVVGNKSSCIHFPAPENKCKITWLLIQEISTLKSKTDKCLEHWELTLAALYCQKCWPITSPNAFWCWFVL